MIKHIQVMLTALAIAVSGSTLAQPRREQPPAGPAPVNAAGRVLLQGADPSDKGTWTPVFGILDPITPYEQIPFQPWSKALYDYRQTRELEPHTRCKASGTARQFLTPYGVEFVELQDLQQIIIFDIGGPHTFRIIYMDGREHPQDWQHTYYGHSVGRWEGNTLVVDSVGFTEQFWLDRRGMPHTINSIRSSASPAPTRTPWSTASPSTIRRPTPRPSTAASTCVGTRARNSSNMFASRPTMRRS